MTHIGYVRCVDVIKVTVRTKLIPHLIDNFLKLFLAIYDNHGYANIHANCLKLMEYAEAHNLTLGDRFYGDVILDDLSTDGYYNYLVKLSIKVK